jgi:hypothetical protein
VPSNTTSTSRTTSRSTTTQSGFHSPANSTLTQGVSKISATPTPVSSFVSGAEARRARWGVVGWSVVGGVLMGLGVWV